MAEHLTQLALRLDLITEALEMAQSCTGALREKRLSVIGRAVDAARRELQAAQRAREVQHLQCLPLPPPARERNAPAGVSTCGDAGIGWERNGSRSSFPSSREQPSTVANGREHE